MKKFKEFLKLMIILLSLCFLLPPMEIGSVKAAEDVEEEDEGEVVHKTFKNGNFVYEVLSEDEKTVGVSTKKRSSRFRRNSLRNTRSCLKTRDRQKRLRLKNDYMTIL